MRNECFIRQLTGAGITLVLVAAGLQAQTVPPRVRGVPTNTPVFMMPGAPTPGAAKQGSPSTAVPAAVAPAPVSQPTSLLSQPAQPAQVNLGNQSLLIRADNSSLSAILRDIAGKSGMKIEGLGSDERVFGSFGPGTPRDVIADLLHGTAYNVVLVGDLNSGAPRELILTPASHGGVAASPTPLQNATEESEPEAEAPPQQPEPQPEQPGGPPQSPGVKTPQQLFEQLQRMRQNQGQQPPDQQPPQ